LLGPKHQRVLKSAHARKSIRETIQGLLRVVSDSLTLDSVKSFIGQGDNEVAGLSLRLWQDLLLIQSIVQNTPYDSVEGDGSDESQFQENTIHLVNESREYFQRLLPSHVFYASVSYLIGNEQSQETRSKALRLIADRAISIDSNSPEILLLVEMLPAVVNVVKTPAVGSTDAVLVQSALVTIEHIA
jgi:hypothetical protein